MNKDLIEAKGSADEGADGVSFGGSAEISSEGAAKNPAEGVDSASFEGTAEASCEGECPDAAALAFADCMPDEELLYDLADLFKVFGDTTRIKILYALMGKELCVAELAQVVGVSQSAVSHQLRSLKQARLVRFQRDGKNVIYSLSDDHVYAMLSQGMTHICE